MEGYISYASHGINAKEFYNDFEVSIAGISRATNISRASATRMVAKHASRKNTQKIVLYLEEISIEDYNYTLQQCKKDLKNILIRVKDAWIAYEKKEAILNEYRNEYGIVRKKEMVERVTIWKLLRSLKDS